MNRPELPPPAFVDPRGGNAARAGCADRRLDGGLPRLTVAHSGSSGPRARYTDVLRTWPFTREPVGTGAVTDHSPSRARAGRSRRYSSPRTSWKVLISSATASVIVARYSSPSSAVASLGSPQAPFGLTR